MTAAVTWQDLLRPGDATNYFDADPRPKFVPDAANYHAGNAWWLAELCRLVYRQDIEEVSVPLEPRRTAILESVGLRQIAFFDDDGTGTQGFLVESASPRYAALVFRGTEQDPRDLLCDLEIGPSLGSGPRVHNGFERAFKSVWPDILPVLSRSQRPLFFAGHSLGAALALLAAAQLTPTAVYAYGCPRIGNAAFTARLAQVPIYRIVHGDDLVAAVPPELLGFRHVGTEHRVGAAARAPRNFDFATLRRELTMPPKPLADHAPINYVRGLLPQAANEV
jgi:hypothetical protein